MLIIRHSRTAFMNDMCTVFLQQEHASVILHSITRHDMLPVVNVSAPNFSRNFAFNSICNTVYCNAFCDCKVVNTSQKRQSMVRQHTTVAPNPTLHTVQLDLVRLFLREATPVRWWDIMEAAFQFEDGGALELLSFCLSLRANRTTRRRIPAVRREWQHRVLQGTRESDRRSWFDELGQSALAMFRVWRVASYPMLRGHENTTMTTHLRRQHRRNLRGSGIVVAELPTLRDHADDVGTERWQSLIGQDVVLWVDNWYRRRYRPHPDTPDLSRDVTAMAVLPLSTTADAPSQRTRGRSFTTFPGHTTLLRMHARIQPTSDLARYGLADLMRQVQYVTARPVAANAIRVPLDIRRPPRPRLQWQTLALSKLRVGSSTELLKMLQCIRECQQHIGQPLPLLVDEKIHYSVMRLLYSKPNWPWDAATWLKSVPILYGCWHPYKHTLTLMHRAFLPIFTSLELRVAPRLSSPVKSARKVAFLERLVAGLLLASHTIRPEVARAIQSQRSPVTQGNNYPRNLAFN